MKKLTQEQYGVLDVNVSMALMHEMGASKANTGEVLITDIQTGSLIKYMGLKDGRYGGYVEIDTMLMHVYPIILIPAIYLIIIEMGGKPTDTIEFGTKKITLQQVFSKGTDDMITKAINQYVPGGCRGLNYYLTQMSSWMYSEYRSSYEDLKLIMLEPYRMQQWMDSIARGNGFTETYPADSPNKKLFISPDSVKVLQEELKVRESMYTDDNDSDDNISINGYSFVTGPDNSYNRNRSIVFSGYFPYNNPKMGVYVRLNRKEQLDDVIKAEWPELGIYAHSVCKKIAEAFANREALKDL